jgi:hypothetical protein
MNDPERYLVAFFLAHQHTTRLSGRKAALALAALQVGNEIAPPPEIAAECPTGCAVLAIGPARARDSDSRYFNTKPGARMPATVQGRAASILVKLRRFRRDRSNHFWLAKMATCFSLALGEHRTIGDVATAAEVIGEFSAEVGELDYAKRTIIPLLAMNYLPVA